MGNALSEPVGRRHVVFVAGYDAMTADGHLRLFRREAARFSSVWSIGAEIADPTPEPPPDNPQGALLPYTSRGPDWRLDGTYEVLGWGDIAGADMRRPLLSHLAGQMRALADMLVSGTIARYFSTSLRYGLFFSLTYVLLALFWIAALLAGCWAAGWAAPRTGSLAAVLIGIAVALAAGFLLMRGPGRRMRLKQSLDLAEFSVDFVRGRHPDLDARVSQFARRLAAIASDGPDAPDEVVLAGHSLGATLLLMAVAEALEADPAFGTRVPVRILTLGNTLAKFALHPAGERLRTASARVAAAGHIAWLEIQSKDDIVSFYGIDPVTLKKGGFCEGDLGLGNFRGRPLLRHVPVRHMISPRQYWPRRLDVMRIHCQCFLAHDRRARHDLYAFILGPWPFALLMASGGGLVPLLHPDGALAPPGSAASHP